MSSLKEVIIRNHACNFWKLNINNRGWDLSLLLTTDRNFTVTFEVTPLKAVCKYRYTYTSRGFKLSILYHCCLVAAQAGGSSNPLPGLSDKSDRGR